MPDSVLASVGGNTSPASLLMFQEFPKWLSPQSGSKLPPLQVHSAAEERAAVAKGYMVPPRVDPEEYRTSLVASVPLHHVHAEFPKWAAGVLVNDPGEEQFATEHADISPEPLRLALMKFRQERHAVFAEARHGTVAVTADYPKMIVLPDGRQAVAASIEEERAMLGTAPQLMRYWPSTAAFQAITDARAEGESDSDTINRLIMAWARWRSSAMKPGERPVAKRRKAEPEPEDKALGRVD